MNPQTLSCEEKELIEEFRRNQEISRFKRVVDTWGAWRESDPRAQETLDTLRSLNHDN